MEHKNEESLKDIIKKELVRTKEDINRGIIESIGFVKDFLTIEDKTGKIFLLNPKKFKNIEKIELLLIGKYLAHLVDIIPQAEVNISLIESELGVKKTTLSGPLSELVSKNIVKKPHENSYVINEANISDEVKRICAKQNG